MIDPARVADFTRLPHFWQLPLDNSLSRDAFFNFEFPGKKRGHSDLVLTDAMKSMLSVNGRERKSAKSTRDYSSEALVPNRIVKCFYDDYPGLRELSGEHLIFSDQP